MRRKFAVILLAVLEAGAFYVLYKKMNLNYFMLGQTLGLYLIYLLIFGHYTMKDSLVWDEIKKLSLVTITYIVSYSFIMPSYRYGIPRRFIVRLTVMMFFVDLILSVCIRRVFRHELSNKTLIIGTSEEAYRFAKIASINTFSITEIVGFIDLNNCDYKNKKYPICDELYYNMNAYKVFKYKDFKDVVIGNRIDQIVICEPGLDKKEMDEILSQSTELVKSVKYVPEDYDLVNFSSEIQTFDGIILIATTKSEKHVFSRLIKRLIDIVISFIGCIISLPVMFIVYLCNHISGDSDPLLYKHVYVGQNGKEISAYKFRIKKSNFDQAIEKNRKNSYSFDSELTSVGKFLYHTHINILPLFFNVLKGNMSFIGPKPYVANEMKEMGEKYAKVITQVKPGMVGMWQATLSATTFQERCQLDFYYVRNWTLWLDIEILCKALGRLRRQKY